MVQVSSTNRHCSYSACVIKSDWLRLGGPSCFFVLYESAAATFNAGSESSLLPRKYTLMQKGKKVQTKKNVRYANYLTP